MIVSLSLTELVDHPLLVAVLITAASLFFLVLELYIQGRYKSMAVDRELWPLAEEGELWPVAYIIYCYSFGENQSGEEALNRKNLLYTMSNLGLFQLSI